MVRRRKVKILAVVLLWLSCGTPGSATAGLAEAADPRNFASGRRIPAESYCDQPRVITTGGAWVCVLTTGPGLEGGAGQHVAATSSTNQGLTWSPLVSVEPADKEKKSSYALALGTPGGRVYAFYCYNGDGIRTKPDGTAIRDDMQGWFCYRYSDDKGQTWSERRRLPMRLSAADRQNEWGGKLQMFWAVGTPTIFDGKVMFGFTRMGRYLLEDGEGWFYRCDNILEENDVEKLAWQLLPAGDRGVRTPEFGSVQEEFDVVHLEKSEFFCVYRTTMGHAACAYSRDGGHSWSKPEALRYAPGGRVMKQPRACTKVWKTRDGRYLLWFHNNGTTSYNNGSFAGNRNIAWLSGGREQDGAMYWSEPEIVAYVDGGLEGCSYPDLIEDNGRFFICATQKTEARVLEVEPELLEGLWNQERLRGVATNGLALALAGEQCAGLATAPAPRLASLCGEIQGRRMRPTGASGFTLEVTARFSDVSPGQVLLDSRDTAGRGYALQTTQRQTLRFEMCDGWQAAFWDADAGLLRPGTLHHIVVGVDGRARVIWYVVDGRLCDGGPQRPFGFGRFTPNFKDVSGGARLPIGRELHGEVKSVRIYGRALRTSEAVGSFHALGPQ